MNKSLILNIIILYISAGMIYFYCRDIESCLKGPCFKIFRKIGLALALVLSIVNLILLQPGIVQ